MRRRRRRRWRLRLRLRLRLRCAERLSSSAGARVPLRCRLPPRSFFRDWWPSSVTGFAGCAGFSGGFTMVVYTSTTNHHNEILRSRKPPTSTTKAPRSADPQWWPSSVTAGCPHHGAHAMAHGPWAMAHGILFHHRRGPCEQSLAARTVHAVRVTRTELYGTRWSSSMRLGRAQASARTVRARPGSARGFQDQLEASNSQQLPTRNFQRLPTT